MLKISSLKLFTTVCLCILEGAMAEQNVSTEAPPIHWATCVDACDKQPFCDDGLYAANPADCQSYYRCVFHEWLPQDCAEGTSFDPGECACLRDEEAQCQGECPPTSPRPTYQPGTCDDIPSPCEVGRRYPDRSSCYHYYSCQPGDRLEREPCAVGADDPDCNPGVPCVFDIYEEVCRPPDANFNCDYRCLTTIAATTTGATFTNPSVTLTSSTAVSTSTETSDMTSRYTQEVTSHPEEVTSEFYSSSSITAASTQYSVKTSGTQDMTSLTQEMTSVTQDMMSLTPAMTSTTNDMTSITQDMTSVTHDFTSVALDMTSQTPDMTSVTQDMTSATNKITTYPAGSTSNTYTSKATLPNTTSDTITTPFMSTSFTSNIPSITNDFTTPENSTSTTQVPITFTHPSTTGVLTTENTGVTTVTSNQTESSMTSDSQTATSGYAVSTQSDENTHPSKTAVTTEHFETTSAITSKMPFTTATQHRTDITTEQGTVSVSVQHTTTRDPTSTAQTNPDTPTSDEATSSTDSPRNNTGPISTTAHDVTSTSEITTVTEDITEAMPSELAWWQVLLAVAGAIFGVSLIMFLLMILLPRYMSLVKPRVSRNHKEASLTSSQVHTITRKESFRYYDDGADMTAPEEKAYDNRLWLTDPALTAQLEDEGYVLTPSEDWYDEQTENDPVNGRESGYSSTRTNPWSSHKDNPVFQEAEGGVYLIGGGTDRLADVYMC